MTVRFLLAATLAGALGGCGGSEGGGRTACGIAMVAGPTTLLDQFSVPQQTLGTAPDNLPPQLVTRVAAGPAYPAQVGRADTSWVVGVDGAMPPNFTPGFGVLVLDQSGKARGIMLYEGLPIEAAPVIGTVNTGAATVPLLGIRLDPTRFEDPRCPFFPDSLLR